MDNYSRITFAIAVFDELRWLRAAVIHLLQFGLKPEDLFLLAEQDAYDGELKQEWERDDDFALKRVATWLEEQKTVSSPPSSGAGLSDHNEPGSNRERITFSTIQDLATSFHSWLIPDHAKELDQHLTNGSGALFVSVLDEDKVIESCQILLRYACRNVQTHQVKF